MANKNGVLVGKKNGKVVAHTDGNLGGYIKGNLHSQGGVKAVNTDTGDPLEVEGDEVQIAPKAVNDPKKREFEGKEMTNKEILSHINQSGGGVPIAKQGGQVDQVLKLPSNSVIITRPAVADTEKREFEGEMLTNKQILSRINQSGGGVAFADGGEVPDEIMTTGKEFNYGGSLMKDHEIVSSCGCKHKLAAGGSVSNQFVEIPAQQLLDKFSFTTWPFGGNIVKAEYFHDGNDSNDMAIVTLDNGKIWLFKDGTEDPYTSRDQIKELLSKHRPSVQFEKGGNIKSKRISHKAIMRGYRIEKDEHTGTFKKLYHGVINPDQAAKEVAKSHLSENSQYYAKYAGGGRLFDKEMYSGGGIIKSIKKYQDSTIKDGYNFVEQRQEFGYMVELEDGRTWFGTATDRADAKEKAKEHFGIKGGALKLSDIPEAVKAFMPLMQQKAIVGSEEHWETLERLEDIIKKMPKTYGTENQEADDKIVYLHYFYGGSDWYIVEKDSEKEQYQAFGYAILNNDTMNAEWGYISIEEIKSTNKIELDFYFEPVRFGDLKAKWQEEEEQEEEKYNEEPERTSTFRYGKGYSDIPAEYSDVLKTQLSRLGFIIADEKNRVLYIKKGNTNDDLITVSDNVGEFNIWTADEKTHLGSQPYDSAERGTMKPSEVAQGINEIYEDYFKQKEPTKKSQPEYKFKVGDKVSLKEAYLDREPIMQRFNEATIVDPSGYIGKEEGYMYDTIITQDQSRRFFYENELELKKPAESSTLSKTTQSPVFEYKGFKIVRNMLSHTQGTWIVYDAKTGEELAHYDINSNGAGTGDYKKDNRENMFALTDMEIMNIIDGLIHTKAHKNKLKEAYNKPFENEVKIVSEEISYPNQTEEDWDEVDATWNPVQGKEYKQNFELLRDSGYLQQFDVKNAVMGEDGNLNLFVYFNDGSDGQIDLARGLLIHSYNPPAYNRLKQIADMIKADQPTKSTDGKNSDLINWFKKDPKIKAVYTIDKSRGKENVVFKQIDGGYSVDVNKGGTNRGKDFKDGEASKIMDWLADTLLPMSGKEQTDEDIQSRLKLFYGEDIIATMVNKETAPKVQPKEISLMEKFKNASQVIVNDEIRKLIKEKGTERGKYSADEISFIQLYEGGGAEKKVSTDKAILTQFFTPEDIVAKMWGLALKYGFNFNGTSILEPAVGSGRFLKYIPKGANVSVSAYEIEPTAYSICKILYPDYDINLASFESIFFRGRRHVGLAGVSKFYDLVISNPPYADYVSEYAPLGERDATGAFTFEMYFIMRGIDVLKSGGLLIYIIPNTFMNNGNKYNDFKEKLAKKCELLDAYRLPNGVFSSTQVGTDIIVLKKS